MRIVRVAATRTFNTSPYSRNAVNASRLTMIALSPTSLAVAAAVTEDLLLGEEMFAAGAYLHGEPAQIASLQLQDILRVIAIAGLLLAALINLVVA